jgi:hypothetical protein
MLHFMWLEAWDRPVPVPLFGVNSALAPASSMLSEAKRLHSFVPYGSNPGRARARRLRRI